MRYIPFAAMVLWLMTACGGCSAQYITEEQAKEAVRAFEGNPSLQLWSVEFNERNEGPEWDHEAWFALQAGSHPGQENSPEDASYRVDAVSGEVTSAGYYHREPPEPLEDPPGPLTQEDCLQIAEDYARMKYTGFDTMNFHVAEQTWWGGTGWQFTWEQTLDYGAISSNYILIEVNPIDGLIQHYRSNRVPVTPVRPTQVTPEQAIEIARQALSIVTVTNVVPPTLFCTPDGGSHWRVEITGLDAEGYYPDDVLLVDAETGEVLGDSGPSGSAPSASAPGRAIVAGDAISLRDLAAKVPDARVHWLGKDGARVFVGKDRYTLVPGKDTIECNGGTIRLSQRMKIVDGRLMVPSGLLDFLKGAPAPKKVLNAQAKSP